MIASDDDYSETKKFVISPLKRHETIYFRPTNQSFASKKDFDEAMIKFYNGPLTEEFMHYCAEGALRSFWLNYKSRNNKVDKKVFCQKFKEFINQLLKEL